MYNYQQAHVRTKRQWLLKDLRQIPISDILTQFEEVLIRLQDTTAGILGDWNPLDSKYLVQLSTFQGTLQEWLTHASSANLAFTLNEDVFSLDQLLHSPTWPVEHIGFNIARANRYIHPDSPANNTGEDLLLRRDNTDYSLFVGKVMWMVNGQVHPAVINEHGVYLREAYKSTGLNVTDIAAVDFTNLGGFEVKALGQQWLYQPNNHKEPLYTSTYLKFPEPYKGKTVGIVLDGYLHLLDDVLEFVADDRARLRWEKVPLLQRWIRTGGQFPGKSTARDNVQTEQDLYSDESLMDILISSHTYLVVFGRNDIAKHVELLPDKGFAGQYFKDSEVRGLMYDSVGSLWSYHVHEDTSQYQIARDNHRVVVLPLDRVRNLSMLTGIGGTLRRITDSELQGMGYHTEVVTNINYLVRKLD